MDRSVKALDLEAVQAFVLTADLKSFTRAAEAMETAQSAVSLKIKRLEDMLGRRLLERTPRLVRLSADGNIFLGPARSLVSAHQGRSVPLPWSKGGWSLVSAITSWVRNCRSCSSA